MNWLEIAEACEKAEGPDRGLDQAAAEAAWPETKGHIASLCEGDEPMMWGAPGRWYKREVPSFTASVEAVLALIEERLPGGAYTVCYADDKAVWPGKPHRAGARVFTADPECMGYEGGHAKSATLALLAAFARAMHARASQGQGDGG